ncbi:hypothetical protein C9J12_02900 [Photobacterium frigidiphilum]|uniref:Glycosyltransferase 2-like domain-containing protein n=1 Tax=Photobacterium frigidiphilum TaxID=264736 RepID=A0A2T3JPE4_9GAMM|nr:glycosyltransferase family 2 protein [Photobacterium frigidiphilum]PSU50931.1 hypothetical protein C9J12_02900 [Photobacterium frigidiphilum]
MASTKIVIIIPAYNEENTIGNVINELHNIVGSSIDIVIVNDCSKDNTSIIAKESGVHVIDLNVNHGYSKAINKGFEYATFELDADYLLTMDADGQHDPHSVNKLLSQLSDNDVVVGRRPEFARLSEWIFGRFFLYRFGISDPLCGLKIYKSSIFKDYGKFETFESIGTELLTWALLNRLKVNEVEIEIRDREDEPRFGSLIKANLKILTGLLNTIRFINKT